MCRIDRCTFKRPFKFSGFRKATFSIRSDYKSDSKSNQTATLENFPRGVLCAEQLKYLCNKAPAKNHVCQMACSSSTSACNSKDNMLQMTPRTLSKIKRKHMPLASGSIASTRTTEADVHNTSRVTTATQDEEDEIQDYPCQLNPAQDPDQISHTSERKVSPADTDSGMYSQYSGNGYKTQPEISSSANKCSDFVMDVGDAMPSDARQGVEEMQHESSL